MHPSCLGIMQEASNLGALLVKSNLLRVLSHRCNGSMQVSKTLRRGFKSFVGCIESFKGCLGKTIRPKHPLNDYNTDIRIQVMDIDKIKMYLADKHRVVVLDDMSGPVGLNGGKAILAKILQYSNDSNEEHIANTIAQFVRNEPKISFANGGDQCERPTFAFLELGDGYIRFASL